jgi:hypothetical protein
VSKYWGWDCGTGKQGGAALETVNKNEKRKRTNMETTMAAQ